MKYIFNFFVPKSVWIFLFVVSHSFGQNPGKSKVINIGDGYAKSSVNATIFRKNSISSFKDHQYVAFYDKDAKVNLAKRKLGSDSWEINKTQYNGNVKDAHNVMLIC